MLSSVYFPRSLLKVAIIVEVLYSCQTVGRKPYLDLVAFSILPYGKAFSGESARQVTYLRGVRNDCFLLNEAGDLEFFLHDFILTPPLCAAKL